MGRAAVPKSERHGHPPVANDSGRDRPARGWTGPTLGSLVATLIGLGLLWGTDIPLGIPGEWTWNRLANGGDVLSFLMALAVGGLWLLLAWAGDRRIAEAGRWERSVWWIATSALGGMWLATMVSFSPFPHGAGRAVWVLYYPGPSGYYTEARSTPDRLRYLAEYRAKVEQGDDVLHVGTHPPGLVAAYWLLDDLRQSVPGLDRFLEATEPDEVREWWKFIDEQTAARGGTVPAGDDRLLWFAGMLVGLSVPLSVWGVAWLAGREFGPVAAWRGAALFPMIPALAVFWPKSDALLAGVSITLIALWVFAWDRRTRVGRFLAGAAAGTVAWLGINLTLGLLPTLVWLGIWTLAETVRARGRSESWRSLAWRSSTLVTGFVVAFVIATGGAWKAFDLPLPAIWLANLRNHAGFYDVYPRSYLGWLVVNPLELALSLGGPLAVCAAFGASRQIRVGSPVALATLLTVLLLWLSGKNSGEAARLWQFQSGWWLLLALPVLAGCHEANFRGASFCRADDHVAGTGQSREEAPAESSVWLVLWGMQLLACAGTVWRVAGFHLPGQ